MFIKFLLLLLTISCTSYGFRTLNNLKPMTDSNTQEDAVRKLITRIISKDATKFKVEISAELGFLDKDYFHIEKLGNGTIRIIGTTGVAVATGFHYYLKYFCGCHISWETDNLVLPKTLPDVNITISLNDRFRYYQNVCTASYSFVWWNWKMWEKHIDWMALNSFNLVLSFNGMEAIWTIIYQKLNLTTTEIEEHFSGPAFLSWNRMGNIRGWGGPLSDLWHRRSIVLQRLILNRMREIGIIPVLPAFSGHVPRAFTRIFPHAKISTTSVWNRFEDKYCCPFLIDPTDPLFKEIGASFLNQIIYTFGTNHAYSCDTFNEMNPSSGEPSYLSTIGQSVYSAMETADPNAVWVMQNWLFVHDFLFWTKTRAKALLTSVPRGKMIVLDLQSEQFPQYKRLSSYYGQPYIWCMLHNFGATLGMFGSIDIINKQIFEARKQPESTLIGIGLTPEGINQNYVLYDLMSEMSWRTEPTNLTTWLADYATRRYGKLNENVTAAWQIFKDTVYSFKRKTKMRGRYAINQRPRTSLKIWIWYNSYDFFKGWELFLASADVFQNSTSYLYDLVDTTRQFLQILGDEYYKEIMASFRLKDVQRFQDAATKFLELLRDMEQILATNQAFLLGKWLKASKDAAFSEKDEELFEYNARNQITLWGPRGEIVDYASKQWSGMVSNFYLPRWILFLQNMNASLISNIIFNESETVSNIFSKIEKPFTFDRTIFPTLPSGDTIVVARNIYKKWWTVAHTRNTTADAIVPYIPIDRPGFVEADYEDLPIFDDTKQ